MKMLIDEIHNHCCKPFYFYIMNTSSFWFGKNLSRTAFTEVCCIAELHTSVAAGDYFFEWGSRQWGLLLTLSQCHCLPLLSFNSSSQNDCYICSTTESQTFKFNMLEWMFFINIIKCLDLSHSAFLLNA